MTEGPWDGSNLPPEQLRPAPPAGGGGGGGVAPVPEHEGEDEVPHTHGDQWPDLGIKLSLGGFVI